MVWIGEPLTALPLALPAVFEAGGSLFVEANGTPDAFGFALDSRLPPDQSDKDRDGDGDPPDGDSVECVPDYGRGGKGNSSGARLPIRTRWRAEFFETPTSSQASRSAYIARGRATAFHPRSAYLDGQLTGPGR